MQHRAIFRVKFIALMLTVGKSKINDLSAYPKKLERAKKTQSKYKKIKTE